MNSSTLNLKKRFIVKVLLPDGSDISLAADGLGIDKKLFEKSNIVETKAVQIDARYEELGVFKNVVIVAPPSGNPFWRKEAWHFIAIKDANGINHDKVVFVPEKWRNGMRVVDGNLETLICRNFFCSGCELEKEIIEVSAPAMSGKSLLADVTVERKNFPGKENSGTLILNIRVKKVFEPTDKAELFLAQPSYQMAGEGGASIPIPGTKKYLNFLAYRPRKTGGIKVDF